MTRLTRALPWLLAGLAVSACVPETTTVTAAAPAAAAEVETVQDCRVTEVIDGDTVRLTCPGVPRQVSRIAGYDAPESGAAACDGERERAAVATAELSRRIAASSSVAAQFLRLNDADRARITLFLDGRDVAPEMIATGTVRAAPNGETFDWCN
jgi:micrococcal nuclease